MAKPRKKRKKRRINKSKLLFVIALLLLIVFLLSRVVMAVAGIFNNDKKETKTVTKTTQQLEKENERIINITIDPAKGGKNEGLSAYGGNQKEKDINLEIAKLIKDTLSKHSDVNVKLSRSYDEDISVTERAKNAKKDETDLLISIRLNGQSSGNSANGFDTYYKGANTAVVNLSENSSEKKNTSNTTDDEKTEDEKTSEEATKSSELSSQTNDDENTDDVDLENDKNSNSSSNVTTSKKNRKELSKLLAENIQKTTLSYVNMSNRGSVENSFDILKYVNMPAVIVQCGFITNKADAEKLENEKFRSDMANGINEGILQFIDNNREELIKDRINYR